MKRWMNCLLLCMVISVFSSCALKIPSLQEAKEVVGAYAQYKQTGNLPSNIDEILGDQSGQASSTSGSGGPQASGTGQRQPAGDLPGVPSVKIPGSSPQEILEMLTPAPASMLDTFSITTGGSPGQTGILGEKG